MRQALALPWKAGGKWGKGLLIVDPPPYSLPACTRRWTRRCGPPWQPESLSTRSTLASSRFVPQRGAACFYIQCKLHYIARIYCSPLPPSLNPPEGSALFCWLLSCSLSRPLLCPTIPALGIACCSLSRRQPAACGGLSCVPAYAGRGAPPYEHLRSTRIRPSLWGGLGFCSAPTANCKWVSSRFVLPGRAGAAPRCGHHPESLPRLQVSGEASLRSKLSGTEGKLHDGKSYSVLSLC